MRARAAAIREIAHRLGDRRLVWGGLRADDAEAISDVPNLIGSFSIVGGYQRNGTVPSLVDFEDLWGVREDLDAWDIEDHLDSTAAQEFREALLAKLGQPSALLPYRPSRFLSSIVLARQDRCWSLGMFGDHQALFEHKPWVESQMSSLGVPHVPWTYVADEEQHLAIRMLDDGPVVLRTTRSSGGAGVMRVDDARTLAECWPQGRDAFVSVSPFLGGALPINVTATAWQDGVTVGPPSVQLIGVPECTSRSFGFCGNDYSLAGEFDVRTLDLLESRVMAIGQWLRSFNYLGTFGVDFLLHEGELLFTEINPRFQGSTHASSQAASEIDLSCVILDHMLAMLGGEAPPLVRMSSLAREAPKLSHFVVHHKGATTCIDVNALVSNMMEDPTVCRVDVVAKPSIATAAGAMLLRVTVRDRVTETGFELLEPWASRIAVWTQALQQADGPIRKTRGA